MPTAETVSYRFEVFWDDFPTFRYYSLRADGAERSLASQTLLDLEANPLTHPLVERFLEMMEQIGRRCRDIRAPGMLRGEINARALPPQPWAWRRLDYLRELGYVPGLPSLRWYAFDADNRILLLFGGGLKTQDDPTHCPNVAYWFRFADRASRYLTSNRNDWAVQGLDLYLSDEAHPLWL